MEVGSNPNVSLTRQIYEHMGGSGSKRRALAFDFSVRIRYVFLISKCRGELDLGVCMTSGLAKKNAVVRWRLQTNSAAKHVLISRNLRALSRTQSFDSSLVIKT